ncbi:hypothetical protein GL50803_0095451 [Giardia duodenalis]|uniref:Uncharacterized protein n=1 Tax=Giardia intestinalis (strain ATCC 50803 / WB clone C6) TaxID=184922 RepID=A8BRS7_GIAIC|nr:hypothetical protein GL50803_0095451 [Giardia intestinalis]KAE8304461.1 hypothetical protein GL50803_0095451 [Giardia intestinalis]|eukprot:XP_001705188.1 Hypothetical protein GL50803_95451 [Giardia lamblia ATCC 50803]
MSGYWTGTTKILLLVGIPCIITTYTIAVVPRSLIGVINVLNLEYSFSWKLHFFYEFRAWFGTVIVLSILVLYFFVSHLMLCCSCSKTRNVVVYCYLASIGTGYCAIVDLFSCIVTPFVNLESAYISLLLIGDLSKYATLSVGIAWLFTVTAGVLLLNTESACLRALTPTIGSLISFGLPLFIVLINGVGHYNVYTTPHYIIASFVLAFLSLVCYLLAYFVEFQKTKILNKYDVFGGPSTSFGRTPASSTTMLSTAHDSSTYRGYSNDAYLYA